MRFTLAYTKISQSSHIWSKSDHSNLTAGTKNHRRKLPRITKKSTWRS